MNAGRPPGVCVVRVTCACMTVLYMTIGNNENNKADVIAYVPSVYGVPWIRVAYEFMQKGSPRFLLIKVRRNCLDQDCRFNPCKSFVGPFRFENTGCCQKISKEKGSSA